MYISDFEKEEVEVINFEIELVVFDSVFIEERNIKGIIEDFLFEIEDIFFGIV